MTKEEIQNMIKDIDTDGDGELTFEEFVTLMQKQISEVNETDEDTVLRAFKNFDKYHDGKITILLHLLNITNLYLKIYC